MNTDYMIRQLDLNKASFEQQLKVKTQEEALFKANADHWCLLQIVCHLVDEEIEDFRIRVKTALDPTLPFIPIDPEGWAKPAATWSRTMTAKWPNGWQNAKNHFIGCSRSMA